MEPVENQSVEAEQQVQEPSNGVSFPTVGEQKKSGGAKTVLIIGILILVAILGFVIYKSADKKTTEDTSIPTSFDNLTTPSSDTTVQTVSPAPSTTPAAVKTDKTKVQIQVQNGTGITGDAAYLQTQLTTLGYTNIKVGNSDSTVTTTTVTFSGTLDSSVVTEITQKLNSLYQTVTTKTSSTATFDVIVITGLRKGVTPKPSSTATPSASVKPSVTPSASPSKSPSPTP